MGTKTAKATPQIRELFIEELAEVHGGAANPLDAILEKLGCCDNSTMACCEEGACCD